MQTLIIYMHQQNCSNVEMSLTISALAETVLADSSRPLQMVSVLASRSSDRLGIVADTPSTLARALHLLGGRESW